MASPRELASGRQFVRGKRCDHLAHIRDHRQRGSAFFITHLAAHQIIGLYAGRAFVDRGDARIAQILRRAGFLDEAHAAMNLHAGRGDFDALLGAPAFDHRNQQVDQRLIAALLGCIGMMLGLVEVAAAT